ncbi:hypothetical protein EMPG_10187 [Blastomyces silverae]|uniref:Uncharacterized protein n=1 Tax=Blastomyces silverae TaxID=2060906 RepID=A0A0H1BB36_9EURO|nr:hypothetical protein EMPG_10187 [Blastomyces silverae]
MMKAATMKGGRKDISHRDRDVIRRKTIGPTVAVIAGDMRNIAIPQKSTGRAMRIESVVLAIVKNAPAVTLAPHLDLDVAHQSAPVPERED